MLTAHAAAVTRHGGRRIPAWTVEPPDRPRNRNLLRAVTAPPPVPGSQADNLKGACGRMHRSITKHKSDPARNAPVASVEPCDHLQRTL